MAIERVMNTTIITSRDHDVSTSLLSRKAIPSYPYTPRTLYASPKREEEEKSHCIIIIIIYVQQFVNTLATPALGRCLNARPLQTTHRP